MDQTDRNILSHLKQDGRAAFTDIADSLDISEGTVRNRVQKMVENDIIENFTVNTANTGISALVMVKVATGTEINTVLETLSDTEFYEVAGEYDLIVELGGENTEELNNKIDDLRAVEGVEDTRTYSVLNEGRA